MALYHITYRNRLGETHVARVGVADESTPARTRASAVRYAAQMYNCSPRTVSAVAVKPPDPNAWLRHERKS
jgi:hypothetical protein